MRLLGQWQRVSRGHVVFAAGCSCGAAATSVRVQDYEQDILAFLRGRHEVQAGSITELLTSMGRQRGSGGESLLLLADLERSIESFESAHRGGGGS